MIETGKNVPEPTLEMNKIIKTLMTIYGNITHILEELTCSSYFDDVESIIGAIMTKEYWDIQEYDYCKKLLKLCEDFEVKHNNLADICKEMMKEQFFLCDKKIWNKFFSIIFFFHKKFFG